MRRNHSWLFYIGLLILFAPLGIFIIWRDKKFPKIIRWFFSLFFGIVFLSAIIGQGDTRTSERETVFNAAETELGESSSIESEILNSRETETESEVAEVEQGKIVTDSYIYEGGVKGGTPYQYGSFTLNSGDKISGQIADGNINGQGEVFYVDGDYYSGTITSNTLDGEGTYKTGDGDVITGVWKEGQLSGTAVIEYANGDRYEGEVSDKKKQGNGMLTFANQDTYNGSWVNDTYNGNGIYTFASGQIYEGEWKDGVLHGSVKYTDLNGKVYQSVWENGLCKTMEPNN